jgi:toxin-antitoxin system PIN domain toxin
MSRPALLDVNVLVALFDPDHIHHDDAHEWFGENRQDGWATCPLTELALARILANPAYSPAAERAAAIVKRFRQFRSSGDHQFWRDSLDLTDDIFDYSFVKGQRQLTDVYLLGLAVKRNGRLATFDRTIPVRAVKGAERETLVVIGPILPGV